MSQTLKFRRDDFSHGLLNADAEGLMAYRNRRRKSLRMQELETELTSVKQELEEIRRLLEFFTPSIKK
jgi:hypothetical protein